MFLMIGQSKWPIAKEKTHQNTHSHLINMDLQKEMIIEGV
jgi:hypothetical protein